MSKQTIAQLLDPKKLEKQNKAFHKMSKRKQRLAIAHDVIEQVRRKRYRASPGTYHRVEGVTSYSVVYPDTDGNPHVRDQLLTDVQKFLLATEKSCDVCGLGAAFCSLSRLGNETAWNDRDRDTLEPIFGKKQVKLIEMAFEGWKHDHAKEEGIDIDKASAKKTRTFFKRRPDPEKRLVAIFKNIIKNDSIFKP
jgi:hypothetical protein